jgi:hypothetical protein
MGAFKLRFLPLVALTLLISCQGSDPPDDTPSLILTPPSLSVNAGDAATTFVATVQNSTETVTWSYSGPGSITPSSGSTTSYTPPTSIDSTQSGSLTAVLGSTGVSATAPIVVYPADVDPTDATDASDPTDPTDPSDPSDPSDSSDPTNPEPPAMTVTIAEVAPVELGADGTATVSLNASANNAPGSTTYKWAAQGNNPGVVTFGSDTSQDTTATFGAEGAYTLRLTAEAGPRSASDTVNVTVNPAPQTVEGVWNATFASGGAPEPFILDLEQTGSDVTGTWTYNGNSYPTTGTFDGTTIALEAPYSGDTITIDGTVTGEDMAGTIASSIGVSYPFTATRVPAP